MADPQFEEFRSTFENLPQYIKATHQCYQIVHDIDVPVGKSLFDSPTSETCPNVNEVSNVCNVPAYAARKADMCFVVQRKRRKLPQIPVDKEPLSRFQKWSQVFPVAAEDSRTRNQGYHKKKEMNTKLYLEIEGNDSNTVPHFRFQSKGPLFSCDGDSLEELQDRTCNDVDSGHSSSHSPDCTKDVSMTSDGMVSYSSSSTISSAPSSSALQLQDATHRGLHKFLPRHSDEIEIDIGDPIYVHKEAEDYWCEGTNLKTGCMGIFPSAYVADVEYSDFDPDGLKIKKERYILDFLGSIEVSHHKGNKVLLQAVRKIVKSEESDGRDQRHPCILEISDVGLRMIDRFRKSDVPSHDFFFSLKNVTFCGYHPYNHRYFGFVTKHPLKHKFACHIFMGESSTRDVAEAVGRAFQRFYQKFIETMYPVEDIYIE